MSAARHRSPSQGASFSTWAKRKPWRARVYVRGRDVHLGYYGSREEAVEARVDAESILRAQAREPAPPFPAYSRG
jgi:hypothetical protein